MASEFSRQVENGSFHGLLHSISSHFLTSPENHAQDVAGVSVRRDRTPLRAGFASDSGPREVNEDSCFANIRDGVFLVADGVGGNRGGALASQLLVEAVPMRLSHALKKCRCAQETLPDLLRQAVDSAQRDMSAIAGCEPDVAHMGSTIVLGVVFQGVLYLTHLGDSRAYLVRGGTIRQLTKDHSWVQAVLDAGLISREEAEQHPFRHVILDCVSADHKSAVNVASHDLVPEDRLVFVTDGVTNVVNEEILSSIVTKNDDPQRAAEELVREALNHKTRDNATCLVVHFTSH